MPVDPRFQGAVHPVGPSRSEGYGRSRVNTRSRNSSVSGFYQKKIIIDFWSKKAILGGGHNFIAVIGLVSVTRCTHKVKVNRLCN